jgi:hypothetical protein
MADKNEKKFRGWWISPEGEAIQIPDHFKYILENPEKFGFQKEKLAHIPWELKGDNRDNYMSIAFQRGWIRVREQKGFTIFQFWEKTESAVNRLKNHIPVFNLSPQDQLAVTESFKKEKYSITVERFLGPDMKQ